MRAPQWKGPSSASGTCLSWTTCCALKSEDGHPCDKQKENKTTTSHQELLNASDPTSDSGEALLWAHPALPQPLLLQNCSYLQAWSEQSCLSSQGHEPPQNKPPPAQSSDFWALCSTLTTAAQPLLPSPRTHLARVSGLIRILKYVFFSCSVIISKTAGVKLKSVK